MKYRIIKGSRGAKCIYRFGSCPRVGNYKNDYTIKKGEFAIDLGDGFVCPDCATNYINQVYNDLIKVMKRVADEGHAELAIDGLYNLEDGDLLKDLKPE